MALARAGRHDPLRGLQAKLIAVVLALAVVVVLGRANPLTTDLGRDSGNSAYIASHILRGNTIYVTAWNQKPPGIYYIDAVGLWLGRGSRWGIWAAELVFLWGASLAGLAGLSRMFGIGPAVAASAVWLAGLSQALEGGNLTEEYSLLFSFISLWVFALALDGRRSAWTSAAVGAALGFSFLLRANNVGVPFTILLTWLLLAALEHRRREALRTVITSGLGFLLPVVATTLYFAHRGAVGPLLEGSLIFNASYASHPDFLGSFQSGVISIGFAAGVGLAGIALAVQTLREQWKTRAFDALTLWLCFDFILEVLLSGLSGRNYPHYFISWLPWIAVASALLTKRLLPQTAEVRGGRAAALLAFSGLAMVVASRTTLAEYARTFDAVRETRALLQRVDPAAQYVEDHTQQGETVLVWGGGAGINFLAHRDAPSAYFLYGVLGESTLEDRIAAQFMHDITSEPPVLILDMAGGQGYEPLPPLSVVNPLAWSAREQVYAPLLLQEFFEFVRTHYTLKTRVGTIPIYRLIP